MQDDTRQGFCVGYKFRLKGDAPEVHAEFIDVWTEMTHVFAEQCGALGSRLHKDGASSYFAYAQWPNEETFESDLSAATRELIRPLRTRFERVSEPAEVVFSGYIQTDLLRSLGDRKG